MSSNCSINCCSSPEITSSNVSVSNMNGIVSNDTTGNRIRTTVPETKKDNKYWERRRRNNEAARRSREKRRQNDMVMDKRILELSQRNKQLENEIFQLKMNFGLVNNSQSKLELEESNNKLISPTTVHETVSKTNNSADDHINGMVFPVFTAFSSGTEIPEIIEKTNTEGLNKTIISSSKINDNPKTCINANKYQSNLINLGNIPLLSNLISTPNLDITSKATLLLPTLLPKPSMKSLDPSTSSGVFNNTTVLDVDKLTFTSTPDICHDQKKRSETIDQPQISPGANLIKMDFQDILDLSLKQENTECFFINTNGSSGVFSRHIVSNDGFIAGNKDTITRSSSENQSMEESMTNSFLSGILSTNSKDRLPDVMQRKPFTTAHIATRINKNKIRRHNPFNDHAKKLPCQNSNRWSSANSVHHDLSLKTRLSIRREVSTIVISENRKLRQDIDRLSNEIKFLKSAMLECAKLTVTKPMANHNSQSIHDRQPLDNKTENSELVFAQFTTTMN